MLGGTEATANSPANVVIMEILSRRVASTSLSFTFNPPVARRFLSPPVRVPRDKMIITKEVRVIQMRWRESSKHHHDRSTRFPRVMESAVLIINLRKACIYIYIHIRNRICEFNAACIIQRSLPCSILFPHA